MPGAFLIRVRGIAKLKYHKQKQPFALDCRISCVCLLQGLGPEIHHQTRTVLHDARHDAGAKNGVEP